MWQNTSNSQSVDSLFSDYFPLRMKYDILKTHQYMKLLFRIFYGRNEVFQLFSSLGGEGAALF